MISILELRHIIECGFLPLSCICTSNPDGTLMVQVFEPSTGHVELLVTGVRTETLTSSRAIAELVGELRGEMSVLKNGARLGNEDVDVVRMASESAGNSGASDSSV
jgi:hypothetical protein